MNIIGIILSALSWVKNNYKLVLLMYAVAMTMGLIYIGKQYLEQKAETERYSNNQTALLTEIETYKTKSEKNAAKVMEMEMTTKEFKDLCEEQANILKDMKVDIKRLENVSTTVSQTSVVGNTILKDTVIQVITLNDTIVKNIQHFEWSDDWNKISGTIDGKDVECRYSGTDTLTIAAVKVPKKFLFFKWGCKYIEVNMVHQNPSSNIVYNRTVKFKK